MVGGTYAMQTSPTHRPIETIILNIRGRKVIIDRDLAQLYEVETKYLNRQVRRNLGRFPEEFMFKLTQKEQFELVTNWHRFESLKHSSSKCYALTEHGVAMLSNVLNSETAVKISIHIINTFIRLRELVISHAELGKKLAELSNTVGKHDRQIQEMLDVIRQLIKVPEEPKRPIGFHAKD